MAGNPVAHRWRHDSENRCRPSVQHCRAETAHQPQRERSGAEDLKIRDVFHQREPRAHRESVDRRVHEESHTPTPQKADDHTGLECFFKQRGVIVGRDVAGLTVETKDVPQPQRYECRATATGKCRQYGTDRHQFETVHRVEHDEDANDWKGSRRDVGHYLRIFTENIASCRGAESRSNAAAAPADTVSSSVERRLNRKSICPPMLVNTRRTSATSRFVPSAPMKTAGLAHDA